MRVKIWVAHSAFALSIALSTGVFAPSVGSVAQGQAVQELVVGFTVDVQTLDPRFVFNTQGGSLLGHIYESLVVTDEKGALQPKLAERWELRDPLTIRFYLRRGIRFHNGEPFDAEAVKYSFESGVGNPRSQQRLFLPAFDRVDVVDPYTVDMKLKSPAARSTLRTLAYYYGLVVPPKFARASGDSFPRAVGTGPYRMVEYRPGDRLTVERNPQYWGRLPGISRIVFRVVADPGTRIASLERGEIDIAYNFPVDQIDRFRGSTSVFILSRPTVRIAYLGFKVNRKPFDDPRVRRALAMSINSVEINNSLLGGRGRVSRTFVSPEVFGYASDVSPPPAFDPAGVRRLLTEAGQGSLRFRYGVSNGRFVGDRQIGEAIAGYFEQVGVHAELEAPEFGTFGREVRKPDGRYDVYMIGYGTNTLDADFMFTDVFHQSFAQHNQYKSLEASALIEKARATTDEKEALELYKRVQEVLMRDLPWVPIVIVPDIIGVSRRLQNVRLRADELIFFWDVTKR